MDNVGARQIVNDIFLCLNKIFEEDKSSSINLFVKNISFPYTPITYPIFRYLSLQNFEGPVLCTNLDMLDSVLNTPSNNPIYYYMSDFEWMNINYNGLNTIKLLTNKNLDKIFVRSKKNQEFLQTFGLETAIISIEALIRKLLYEQKA